MLRGISFDMILLDGYMNNFKRAIIWKKTNMNLLQ